MGTASIDTQDKVCVEPRPSALNMTLPAFAAVLSADIDRRLVQQQTTRTPLLLSLDGTDGRTEGLTETLPLHKLHTMQTASINE